MGICCLTEFIGVDAITPLERVSFNKGEVPITLFLFARIYIH